MVVLFVQQERIIYETPAHCKDDISGQGKEPFIEHDAGR